MTFRECCACAVVAASGLARVGGPLCILAQMSDYHFWTTCALQRVLAGSWAWHDVCLLRVLPLAWFVAHRASNSNQSFPFWSRSGGMSTSLVVEPSHWTDGASECGSRISRILNSPFRNSFRCIMGAKKTLAKVGRQSFVCCGCCILGHACPKIGMALM